MFETGQYNGYLVSTVDADGLVLLEPAHAPRVSSCLWVDRRVLRIS